MFRSIICMTCLFVSFSAFSADYKVLSWNSFFLPTYLKKAYQVERLPKFINVLENSDYDFILLQEVFTKTAYKRINRAMKAKGYYSSGKPFRRFYKPINSGLIIFSKYPLTDVKIMLFDHLAAEDKFSSKGVLFAKASLPNGDVIQLANTHFQSKSDEKYKNIRKTHINQIQSVFKNVFNDENVPVIFGGDFNIGNNYGEEFSDFMAKFKKLGLTTLPPASRQTYTSDCIVNSLKKLLKPDCEARKQVDFIFHRPSGYHLKSKNRVNSITDLIVIDYKDNYKTKNGHRNMSLSDHMSVEALIDL